MNIIMKIKKRNQVNQKEQDKYNDIIEQLEDGEGNNNDLNYQEKNNEKSIR